MQARQTLADIQHLLTTVLKAPTRWQGLAPFADTDGDLAAQVLDEADHMLDLGFLPDVEKLFAQTSPTRHTMLFSATMPKLLVEFVKAGLKDPLIVRLDADGALQRHADPDLVFGEPTFVAMGVNIILVTVAMIAILMTLAGALLTTLIAAYFAPAPEATLAEPTARRASGVAEQPAGERDSRPGAVLGIRPREVTDGQALHGGFIAAPWAERPAASAPSPAVTPPPAPPVVTVPVAPPLPFKVLGRYMPPPAGAGAGPPAMGVPMVVGPVGADEGEEEDGEGEAASPDATARPFSFS